MEFLLPVDKYLPSLGWVWGWRDEQTLPCLCGAQSGGTNIPQSSNVGKPGAPLKARFSSCKEPVLSRFFLSETLHSPLWSYLGDLCRFLALQGQLNLLAAHGLTPPSATFFVSVHFLQHWGIF